MLGFFLFLAPAQIRDTNIKLFWSNEYMACCNAVLDETLLWVYEAMDEERVMHLTLVLLCRDRFGSPVTDS
jgi:hypothetical protein